MNTMLQGAYFSLLAGAFSLKCAKAQNLRIR